MQLEKFDKNIQKEIPVVTQEELSNEYFYLVAEEITNKMLKSGLLTKKQYDKLMEKNKQSFKPLFSRI